MSDMDATFADLLRAARDGRGWSLRTLAEAIHFSRSYVGNIEQGRKFPVRDFAERADEALGARGELLAAWERENADQEEAERTRRDLAASLRDSELITVAGTDRVELERIAADVERLAVGYLSAPAAPMLTEALDLRAAALRELRRTYHPPGECAELYLALGRLSGVLAYAALDLGESDVAFAHARAAWKAADHAQDNELRAWVRGTQSLIARFAGQYELALDLVRDGRQYATRGTAEARILCGEAQCLANLGDDQGANHALDLALDARGRIRAPDTVGGLFVFSEAKQHYYAGSSLIWLQKPEDFQRAAREAEEAIRLWEQADEADRSLDDEALAHVYLATARLQLGQLDGAITALDPILNLPPERRISWITKRMDRISDMLADERYRHSPLARDTRDLIDQAA
jgi:transcriptional regulator with XRE-family HTH domain